MRLLAEGEMLFWNYDLNKLVRMDHVFRKIDKTVDFVEIAKGFQELSSEVGRKGYGVEVGIRCLFMQFYLGLSDREMEDRMKDDLAVRWFCKIKLEEESPDHSYFGRIRKLLGTRRIGKVFKRILRGAEDQKILREVFSFVDSTAIISKETTWTERDHALKAGEEKLNNKNVSQYGADEDARFGCKGKDKFWYGYKRHVSADMGSGLITKVAVTPANVTDSQGLENVCPPGGMVFADKAYCSKQAQLTMAKNIVHSGAILKNNMKGKNKDKDYWISRMRSPFENIFSKLETRARYRGLAKVQFQGFMEAIVFNVRRLLTIQRTLIYSVS